MLENELLYKRRALTLGSGCKLAFIKHTEKINVTENNETTQQIVETIKPVLILTGINNQGIDGNRISSIQAEACVGIVTSEVNIQNQVIQTGLKQTEVVLNAKINGLEQDWLTLNYEQDKIVYPRIFINSLQLKTDSNSLVVNYQDYNSISTERPVSYITLKPYEDYSVLTRSLQKKYAITLDPELVIKQGIVGSYTGTLQPRHVVINYSISNADTSIYLDALQVAKQNSMPKVSYDVKCNIFNNKICETLYNKIGNIIRINDDDLKFKNVRGYISGFSLDLDNPDNDNIEIKNYKTKFEDLFSTITAQTEQMKKNNSLMEAVSSAFTSTGDLTQETLQSSIMKVDLDYAFNNGNLTIDEHNGIWATSDTGVVAFRGGGIFTSTEKNTEGNWKWNTGITPEGINASLISTGQLDTNLIKIYSGDNLRFQMNGDGIFAYKSIMSDSSRDNTHPQLAVLLKKIENNTITEQEREQLENLQAQGLSAAESIDGKQYVLFNDEGLTLIAKKGAKVLDSSKNNYKIVLNDDEIEQLRKEPNTAAKANELSQLQQIKRVEVSWDGFVLRNWHNDKVFYADPDTGDLIISGQIYATGGRIGAWNFDKHMLWADTAVEDKVYTTFVALNAGGDEQYHLVKGDKNHTAYTKNGRDLVVDTTEYAFWAGDPVPQTAPFSIQKRGFMKALSGEIGGWTIQSDRLYSNVISLSSAIKEIGTNNNTYTAVEKDEKITSTASTLSGGRQAALWVHGTEDQEAKHSLLYITSTGDLYAQQLYFITGNNNGYYNCDSVKSLIETAQDTADKAYKKAKAVESQLSQLSYVVRVDLSSNGVLSYYINGHPLAIPGGQHISTGGIGGGDNG